MQSSIEKRVINAFRTLMQMLKDRDYQISDEQLNISRDELMQKISTNSGLQVSNLN